MATTIEVNKQSVKQLFEGGKDHSDRTEERDKLNQMRRTIESEFGFNPIQDIIWEQARDKLIDDVNDPQTKL